MQVRILGEVQAVVGGAPVSLGGPKPRLVLALLLAEPNRRVSTDALTEALWHDDRPSDPRATLQVNISNLRRALDGTEVSIEFASDGYLARVPRDQVDACRFTDLVAEGTAALPSDPQRAARVLRDALALWGGTPFGDLAGEPSLAAEVVRLDQTRLRAVEKRLEADVAVGDHEAAVEELRQLTREHPLREGPWQQLMIALYRADRQAEALETYDQAASQLRDQLGLDPSQALRDLRGRILRQDPSLATAGVAGGGSGAATTLRGYTVGPRVRPGRLGVIHRGRQPGSGRAVALELVEAAAADASAFVRHFAAVAERVGRVDHPAVAALEDAWREPGQACLVTRWVDGTTLASLREQGPADPSQVAEIVDDIAGALDAAAAGQVPVSGLRAHDVVVDHHGHAVITGLASMVLGQVVAEDVGQDTAGSRPDVVDLVRLAFTLLAGQRVPVVESARAGVAGPGTEVVPPLGQARPDLPAALGAVLARANDPADGFESAAAFAAAFGEAARPLRTGVAPPSPVRNPFKGLQAFREPDAADFFGRDELVGALLQRMERGSVAVVGPSGAGKSSLVRAGLIPAARSRGWLVASMQPGEWPMAELEGALTAVATSSQQEVATALGSGDEGLLVASDVARRHGREPLLLAIDQFEECYGLARQEDRDAFVRRLARCVHGERDDVRVVVTVRADHYDDLLLDPHLGPWVADNTLAVSPMSGQELHEAITRPAARVGVDVEPHLVARMATEALGERARLPLVQFTLTELFSGREGGRLTLDAYERIGGVSGALVGRAEQLYATLDDRSQRLCRQVFLRLVTVTDGPDESLRRVLRDELLATGDADAVGAVLELFGRHRLLTFDRDPFTRRPTVEIAHHALTREWGRLRGWIDAARADIEMHHRVRAAADEWRLAGRDPSYLLRGTRLDEALAWMSASSIDLTDAERGFLEEGDQARRRRAAAERDRLEREAGLERRARRRLRTVAVVSAVAALVAVGLSAVAVQERSRAQQAQAAAEREARVAQARRLAAASMVQSGGDPDLGILLAIEAVRTTREQDGTVVPEAHQALLDAVVSSRLRDRFPGIGGHLALSPDGDLLVTEGPEDSGLIDVRDARTGDSIHAFHGHGASVGRRPPDLNAVTFGPDGRRLATTGDDGTLRIWDRVWETGGQREQFVFRGDGPSQVWGPSFHPDGELVAAAWADEGVVRVFDLATGQMTLELDGLDYPYAARFGPAGDRLAVPEGRGGRAVVLDAATGDQLLALPEGGGRGLAWSPDGRHLLTTSPGATARVWDTTDGSLRAGLFGHTHEVASGAWSSDGTRLATGSLDGTVRVWRLAEGGAEPLAVLGAAPTGVQGLAFTPDGTALYAGEEGDADATTVRVWDLTGTTTDAIATFPAATDGPSVVEHLAGGPVLLVSTGGETVTGWDVGTGRSVIELATELDGHGPLMDVASSPDGTRIAIAVGGHLSLRDADGDVVADVATPRSIGTVGWHPDSDRLAIGDRAGEVRVLGRDGEELATLLPDGGRSPTWAAYDVAFSPAGDLLAVAGGDPTQPNSWHVELWDWDAGQIQTTVATSGFNARAVAFAPDGTTIATVGFDAAELFDVATGDRIARLPGHGGPVLAVDFQPDGTRLATGGADATVRLWDPDAARQTLTIDGHRSAVESISFSADGTRLAAGDADGHARIWPLDVDELLRIAEDRVTRGLTDAECRQYLLTGSCPREWSRDLAGLRHG